MFPKLNLPTINPKVQERNGKIWIFDTIRKKFILLTPEEWVRQHFVSFLINHHQYPKPLIRVERGLFFNELKKRTDISVYDRLGNPWMIIECKNPYITIDNNTLQQIATYNSVLKTKYLVVTNGLSHYYYHTQWERGTVEQLAELPQYSSL